MFGPNTKSDTRGKYYHHRESEFRKLLIALQTEFSEKFGLSAYNLLFITGNGTLVNEMVIASLRFRLPVIGAQYEFGRRLQDTFEYYSAEKGMYESHGVCYALYETSCSRYNKVDHYQACMEWVGPGFTFADMVSAFPYYLPPRHTDIWTTVSSKQLGSYPVLGIIGIKKGLDLDEWFDDLPGSYLWLKRHWNYQMAMTETIATPAIPLYYDLLQEVRAFDREALRKQIHARRDKLTNILGEENIIGEGPVLTINKNNRMFNNVLEAFNVYESQVGRQIFLWSGGQWDYEKLYTQLERAKNGRGTNI